MSGELDLLQAGDLTATLTEAAGHDDTTQMCVDLAAVTFIDSTVIGALLQGYHAAHTAAIGYTVTGMNGQVQKVLQVAGVLATLQGQPPSP
ncbi:anti-sigma B factor antagonist [Actinoplanes octamycinicus]|uniref:Anti-sigma B factor antagonist n=1 Tax=Actinoplanes octamycinicus TaxID=135948 RepID=A0A7W7H4S6_9ACTN|nr:anti-sigma B factor antagonist [Actinoplanes octamycinicus]